MSITEKRKRQKINLIFNTIREHPDFTKTEVKKYSGLSMESVMQYVEELLREGYICFSGTTDAKVGRKGECLRVNPRGAYFIGIKFTALSVSSVLVDLVGNVIGSASLRVEESNVRFERLMDYIYRDIDRLITLLPAATKIKSIGIGAPGFVDSEYGIIKQYFNVSQDFNLPLKQMLQNRYGIPTYLAHTVKTKAISYRLTPANKHVNDFIYVLIGSGIAMASMIDGKLYRSVANNDGEIGHIIVRDGGELCACGKRGCLETVAGNEAVLAKIRAGIEQGRFDGLGVEPDELAMSDFVAGLSIGDGDCLSLIDEVAHACALVISSAVAVLGPPKVVLCGEYIVTQAFQQRFERYMDYFCLAELRNRFDIQYIRNDQGTDAVDASLLGYYHQFYNAKLI